MTKKDRHLEIEIDPERAQMWREAWDLLLTDTLTLDQICQVLHNRGYTRKSGKPWVWESPASNKKNYAASHLSRTFHSPFYAGWVTSPRHKIQRGEIRGKWQPIVTDEEFERGLQILARHDENKVRLKRYLYLLSGLLYMKAGDSKRKRLHKMAGTTPRGRYRSYSYYQTLSKPKDTYLRVSCQVVDETIPGLLEGIRVAPEMVPAIRKMYQEHMAELKGPDVNQRIADLDSLKGRLNSEEAALARLYAQGKLTDGNYTVLYREWQTKMFETEQETNRLRDGAETFIDDLDAALVLLTQVHRLFERLPQKKQARLLQILFQRIIIDADGRLLDFELNPPFVYLDRLNPGPTDGAPPGKVGRGSEQQFSSPPFETQRNCPVIMPGSFRLYVAGLPDRLLGSSAVSFAFAWSMTMPQLSKLSYESYTAHDT